MKLNNGELSFEIAKAMVLMRFEFKFEDFWVGVSWKVFWDDIDILICFIPCFPLHITICKNFEKTFDVDHDQDILGLD